MSVDVLQVTMHFKPWKQDVASKPFTVLHENYKKVEVELLSACSRPWAERGAGVFIQYSAPTVMHLLRLPCESSLGEIGDRALEMILVPYGILSLGCVLDPRMESYPLGSWHLYESQHSYSTCWSLPCCTLLALGTCSNATVILPPGIPHRLPLPVCSAALLHNVFVPP